MTKAGKPHHRQHLRRRDVRRWSNKLLARALEFYLATQDLNFPPRELTIIRKEAEKRIRKSP